MTNYDEVEVSAGHWDLPNSGAVGILKEAVEIRKVCRRVNEYLTSFKVPFTYYEDNKSNNQRDNVNYLVNKHNEDTGAFICQIHFNAFQKTDKPKGTEVLYANPQMKGIAAAMSKAISSATGGGLLDRGAKHRDNIGVLTRTKEHAILIEVCFVDSTIDAAIYNRDFDKICKAIAINLAAIYGKTINEKGELTMSQYNELKAENEKLKKEIQTLKELVMESPLKNPSATHAASWGWATELGIVNGKNPRDFITRQQAVSMLQSYNNVLGKK